MPPRNDAAAAAQVARVQRIRMRLQLTATASYAVDATFLLWYAWNGSIAPFVAHAYLAGGGAICALSIFLHRTNLNLRFADPGLTVPLMLAAMTMQFGVITAAPQIGFPWIANLFTVLAYGTLSLNVRQFFLLAAGGGAGAVAVILLAGDAFGSATANFVERVVSGLFLASVFGRSLVVSLFANDLRERLARSRQRLAVARTELGELNAALEDRVARRTDELEETVRELESFSYSASHDLRAPLRAISANAALLRGEHAGKLDAEARAMLERMGHEAERADLLLNGLLELTRLGRRAMERQPVDVSALVRSIADRLAGSPEGARVEFRIEPGLRAVADDALLRIALDHLLQNAVKFSRHAGHPRVEVTGETADGARCFRVADNGMGFEQAYVDKLFRPFHRLHTEAQAEGIGIGLAFARRVVERHGGRIWAQSTPGEGAVFRFTLPETPAAPGQPAPH